ncbi:hypothetical protein [Nocardia bovistercoris]|uniref:Uncharacterized protein n=1 Tax=Nocardia bovistercoris TaxID=2785916 RepID=A0A931N445_9NOCA|nr:hypothetical protein [Nocardia bovistercoris]MBH0781340.1 hypothetical protein [Nocardia bovistercoris]
MATTNLFPWWDSLMPEARYALLSDPYGPVPVEHVPELRYHSDAAIHWREDGTGAVYVVQSTGASEQIESYRDRMEKWFASLDPQQQAVVLAHDDGKIPAELRDAASTAVGGVSPEPKLGPFAVDFLIWKARSANAS